MGTGINIKIGKLPSGENFTIDLAQAPHILVAGATGSGKSVFLYSLICQIISNNTPEEARFVLCDPKLIEFGYFQKLPHLIGDIAYSPEEVCDVLEKLNNEFESRILKFSESRVKNIDDYNSKNPKDKLPHIFVMIDEFADIMAKQKRKFTKNISKLVAMAGFTGIHVILTTQRVQNDVITGVIRVGFPIVISFAVNDKKACKIIGVQGADKLTEKGEFLYQKDSEGTAILCKANNITEEMIEEAIRSVTSKKI